jgi:membrane-associated protease RseP (regulator of RpoE activity)
MMLASHEFGHYVAARLHRVDSTLPFFLPFPPFGFLVPFGTLGAVIRVRSGIPSRKATFDIGAAGPIAGFVVSVVILIVGFRTLPPVEYLYAIHPEYAQMTSIPQAGLAFGPSVFYKILASLFSAPGAFVPPMNEVYHYPFLCVGWFGMFITALNLIPIGQLDGGHITFALFGNIYHRIGQVSLIVLIVLGTLGFLPLVGFSTSIGWTGWLFWAIVLTVFLRRSLYSRPPLEDMTPLDPRRVALGWLCIVIFLGSFSFVPFTLEMP